MAHFTHNYKFEFQSGLKSEGEAEFNTDGSSSKKSTYYPPDGMTLEQEAQLDAILQQMVALTRLFGIITEVSITKKP